MADIAIVVYIDDYFLKEINSLVGLVKTVVDKNVRVISIVDRSCIVSF